MRQASEGGQDIYIRVPSSELEHHEKSYKKKIVGIITGSAVFLMCLILGLAICAWKYKFEKPEGWEEDSDLPTFDLSTIFYATNRFSSFNKLGEGGFGPVYKGVLADGTEIAVKRLSKNSDQGQQEFKTEVQLIAKLQHHNLVKLLGCCIKQKEKLLIYEFMPNGSLDHFIFDDGRRELLDWTKRFQIISGIARGLLYLHHDSRLRIIHRDLKTSNILLDCDMNPKILDFGLARIFGGDQTVANTKRVMGTHGYISPEYAMHGSFSIKSMFLALVLNINEWEMMISLGFMAAASVRVANELGRGSAKGAKFSIVVNVLTSFAIGFFLFIFFLFFRERLAYIFPTDEHVARAVGDLSPLLSVSILLNSVQPVLSGVAVGAGWQIIVAYVNIGCYYLIGIPVGIVLGNVLDLQVKGIWVGMLFGTLIQTIVLIIITYKTNWDEQAVIARSRISKWTKLDGHHHKSKSNSSES